MTREEAIQVLESMKSEESYNALIDLCNIAIEALQREEAEEKGYCHRIKPKGGDTE